jgi:hypothetical protein
MALLKTALLGRAVVAVQEQLPFHLMRLLGVAAVSAS